MYEALNNGPNWRIRCLLFFFRADWLGWLGWLVVILAFFVVVFFGVLVVVA